MKQRATAVHSYTGETLTGDLGAGIFPEIRVGMLNFVGQFLVDFERAAQAAGLTVAQARVLGFAAMKPSSMREIADLFGCDPSNITAKVDRLIELGLVERQADPDDGRVKLIAATEKGLAMSAEICTSREWLAKALAGLDDDEIAVVRAAMDLLTKSTSSLG